MARRRRGEAEAAAALLDVDLAWIGLPEGDWQDDELVGRLETLIERTSADLVYAPSRVDFHPEHRRVASSLARALERRGELLPVRVYEVQVPLTGVLVNRVADTSRLAIPVRRAVRAYATQLASLRRTLRSRRYAALRYRVGREAEVFWEISSLAYAALHPSHPETAPSGFRGIRQLPLTDPLAYLTGRDERRRLSLAAADPDLARAAAR
jgi:LmbE family N-acetylglucosaminyl deacetylase